MKKLIRTISWAMSLVMAIVLGILVFSWYSEEMRVQKTQEGQTEVQIGGDFSLTDHTGKPVTYADFADKPLAIYFGYTFCPDVCPTTLSEMTLWVEELGGDAQKMNFVFVTVDPERDTQEAMGDYVDAFFDQLIGLRGTREQTDAVIKAYKVYAKKVDDGSGDGDYVMDHTASVFLMKKGGAFSGTISFGEAHDSAVEKLRNLIASAE
ncbi:protein SCO1/2 [Cohaesibacter marisflavi]|uniref:Protein SCO1/2 n=1 Tax=Cohaesibacter marisflavi TaxID=655353 RepID=A0A1I5EA39_9HYPH|nr:SCO family protein [Cohaesibacter marisflavi]SFO08193.1 protein SCO1/2 [Cohaesibacter marisflavi]